MSHVLGASRVAAAIGCDKFTTPHQLWEEMCGLRTREANEQMWRGIYLESGLVDWWAHLEGATDVKKQVRLVHPTDARLGATLDATGVIRAELVAAETKCPRTQKTPGPAGDFIWGGPSNAAPLQYRIQLLFQMGMGAANGMEFAYGHLAAGPLWGELIRVRVDNDFELFDLLVARCGRFLDYVDTGVRPPDDWGADLKGLK